MFENVKNFDSETLSLDRVNYYALVHLCIHKPSLHISQHSTHSSAINISSLAITRPVMLT